MSCGKICFAGELKNNVDLRCITRTFIALLFMKNYNCFRRMSHGNATPEDARRVAHWIDQESQTRIGIRACLADLRRERDRIAKAFDKIQQERKKAKEQKSDFDLTKKNQQKHCNHLHNILDGMID